MYIQADIVYLDSIQASDKVIFSQAIKQTLGSEQQKMVHGEAFTGRPSTQIFASTDYVIKLKKEYQFKQRDALLWIEQKTLKEQQLGVHHPKKIWFLLIEQEQVSIANITPKLTPLHQLETTRYLAKAETYLCHMLDIYFLIASQHEILLDGGLSNFGIDDLSQKLYYLDDDTYRWDNFHALGQTFGVWFRALDWLTPELAGRVGHHCYHLTIDHFNQHSLSVIIKYLGDARLFSDQQLARKEAFLVYFLRARKQPKHLFSQMDKDAPVALLADIHANQAALDQVLQQLDEQLGQYNLLVLGDIVGYGPNPCEVIERLKQRNAMIIKGNHDLAIAEEAFGKGFSPTGREVASWTREQLTQSDIDWLNNLPCYLEQDDWLAVHGSPIDPQFLYGYVYRMTYELNLDNLRERDIRYCFHGHSHIQGVYYRNNRHQVGFSDQAQQSLSDYKQALICPGSVGQPREGKGNHSRYAVYQPKTKQLSLHQVAYDVESTIKAMHSEQFPEVLMSRLRRGV